MISGSQQHAAAKLSLAPHSYARIWQTAVCTVFGMEKRRLGRVHCNARESTGPVLLMATSELLGPPTTSHQLSSFSFAGGRVEVDLASPE